jgi:pilus assembly protein Flp/PilA
MRRAIMKFTNVIQKLYRDESGATAIEYGLIAALIAVGIIVALTNLQGSLTGIFDAIGSELDSAPPA